MKDPKASNPFAIAVPVAEPAVAMPAVAGVAKPAPAPVLAAECVKADKAPPAKKVYSVPAYEVLDEIPDEFPNCFPKPTECPSYSMQYLEHLKHMAWCMEKTNKVREETDELWKSLYD
jgi:hypothetical protein